MKGKTMKKILSIFSILLAFMACNNENLVIDTPSTENESNEISVNLTITRSDDFGSTKATVKSAWADNDVIFVFFKGIAAPEYLEMKYSAVSGEWTSTGKNGLTSSDLSDAADKKMTAIYLPYGSTATVAASEGNFIFSDITYSGYFLKAELVDYTLVGGVLSGTLSMSAPALSNESDKLIHFDISGFTSGHNYKLYQDYVKPLTLTSVSADGVLTLVEGTVGASITGYEDSSMMSFSGILDASAVGNAVDYQFSIEDITSSILYTRDAGTKTLSTSKYIGIGAINNPAVWNAFEYVDLGLSVKWATFNVGATAPEEYGDYFAWGDAEPYYEAGYAQETPQTHWKEGKTDGYSWDNYKWCNGSETTLTKYFNNINYGNFNFIDTKTTLDLEDDVAHVKWGGSWRMPTSGELDELRNNCTCTWYSSGNAEFNGVAGYKVTSNIEGYTDRFIFLPAAGLRFNSSLHDVGSYGYYWSSSLFTGIPYNAWYITFSSIGVDALNSYRSYGKSVRPVSPSETWFPSVSITLNNNTQSIPMSTTYTLIATVKYGNDVIYRNVVWTSANPSIATVNETGVVTGVGVGSTTISATSMGKTATCTITVTPPEPEYVDLGLSVKWATFNVGATKPEEYGDYFAWGETETNSNYSWDNYKLCNGDYSTLTKYCRESRYGNNGITDTKTTLDMEDDVAHVKWGGSWRMPTKAEQDELCTNCTWTWTSLNGVNGYLVTSNKTGYTDRSIFLPAAGYRDDTDLNNVGSYGYYWSSSLGPYDSLCAYDIGFNSYNGAVSYNYRYDGQSVRPVCP